MLELLLWISGIILSIILTIILTDPINFALANVFGEVKVKENDISGIWKAIWWQEKENKKYKMDKKELEQLRSEETIDEI